VKFPVKATHSQFAVFVPTLVFCAIVISSTQLHAETIFANLDQVSGWQSCTVCAGVNGNGPSAKYAMTPKVASPSMDGHSTRFSISGTKPYSDALWWKQLGAHDNATHFVYDLYFYYTNPSAPQALEFDVNQTVKGKWYIFGTQCEMRSSHQWQVWNDRAGWQNTGVACTTPKPYVWNHLTWEFQRAGGKVQFVSLTFNGQKHYINRSYAPRTGGSEQLNVAFQMDMNKSATAYQVWLDKVSLSVW
jgi:hypothetical protein